MIAERPKFDDVKDCIEYDSLACNNCWCNLSEPYIKGLFVHQQGGMSSGCIKIEPIPYRKIHESKSKKRYNCEHEFRHIPELINAVKCIKCGVPIRNGIFELDLVGITNAFCFDCDKEFKNIQVHQKKHKQKGFEFKILPTLATKGNEK